MGRGRRLSPQIIKCTLFRLACNQYLFTGVFSQAGGKYVPASQNRRGGELLPGVGCCHGVPSGDSIGARQAHRSLNASETLEKEAVPSNLKAVCGI